MECQFNPCRPESMMLRAGKSRNSRNTIPVSLCFINRALPNWKVTAKIVRRPPRIQVIAGEARQRMEALLISFRLSEPPYPFYLLRWVLDFWDKKLDHVLICHRKLLAPCAGCLEQNALVHVSAYVYMCLYIHLSIYPSDYLPVGLSGVGVWLWISKLQRP